MTMIDKIILRMAESARPPKEEFGKGPLISKFRKIVRAEAKENVQRLDDILGNKCEVAERVRLREQEIKARLTEA